MCQDPKNIRDPGSPGSRIRDLEELGSYIFIFSWDLRDLRSCHDNIAIGSKGSWISERKYSAWSWGSWIHLEQVVVGSCRSWILHINNITVFWASLTSNEILPLVPHIYTLVNFDHHLEFQSHIDSSILCWLENKPTLLVSPHVSYYRWVVNRMW